MRENTKEADSTCSLSDLSVSWEELKNKKMNINNIIIVIYLLYGEISPNVTNLCGIIKGGIFQ